MSRLPEPPAALFQAAIRRPSAARSSNFSFKFYVIIPLIINVGSTVLKQTRSNNACPEAGSKQAFRSKFNKTSVDSLLKYHIYLHTQNNSKNLLIFPAFICSFVFCHWTSKDTSVIFRLNCKPSCRKCPPTAPAQASLKQMVGQE